MLVSYMFQFLDKSALGFSALLGVTKQLNMTGFEFSWASGLYYVGFLAAAYPASLLMVRWHVAKTIAVSM